ncbi:MAG: hypothetical protein GY795_24075 [Desulfobacterales bacterium]|nr:hypothetical protein [Desulfobacterales bacterium]
MKQISFDKSKQNKADLIPDPDLLHDLHGKEKESWINYLYANPRSNTTKLNLRQHMISLYDPFALRKDFQANRRWCVNVYVGCIHSCKYCYIISYIPDAFSPRIKKNFKTQLEKDLKEINRLKLHPAPIHISNSTDPLQKLEKKHQHTLFLLEQLQKHRENFSTITMLTKNPALLCEQEYMEIIKSLDNFQVEVTCPFYDEESRRFFEPHAPSVESRLTGIRTLCENKISVSLRIDPIFPRNPLPDDFFGKPALEDYGICQSQTLKDIEQLIEFASEEKCSQIIVSPLKLTVGNYKNKSEMVPMFRGLYAAANNGKLFKKGPAYRLPDELNKYWRKLPENKAQSLKIPLIFCKKNLFGTK